MSSEDYEVICHSDDREEWLKARRLGLGGSDSAAVLGLSKWSSPVSVFAAKVLDEEEQDNEAMYWGRKLEPVILEHYGQETGRNVTPDGRLLRSLKYPFMQVTLDALQWQTIGDQDRWGFVEAKNTRLYMTNGVPEDYWVQMQHQYAVTGYDWGSFAVLVVGSQFYWCDVERNDEFIETILIPRERELWERVKARGPTPAPDASQATLDALKRLYPRDNGETVTLDGEFIDLDMRRQVIAEELSLLTTEKQGIENKIKARLGDATTGMLPSGRAYTWKANKNGTRVLRAPTTEAL